MRMRPSATAGSIAHYPTPNWTTSSPGLLRRIASFPAEAVRATKQVLNELTLPAADAVRADATRFQHFVASDAVKARMATLFAQGLQTRGDLELDLGNRIGSL